MSVRLQIILLVLIIALFLNLLMQVKRRKLQLKYTISWFGLLIILFIVVVFPQILHWMADVTGIALPINMVFFLGFCFSLLIIFRLTQAVSKLSDEVRRLTQRIALDEKERSEKK